MKEKICVVHKDQDEDDGGASFEAGRVARVEAVEVSG
jgi:hypothetical protein